MNHKFDGSPDGTDTSRPHVVMIVPNSVEADARVRKSADSAASAGLQVTVLGTTSNREEVSLELGDWECRLLPLRRYVDLPSDLMGRRIPERLIAKNIHEQLRNELSWIGYRRRETESSMGWHRDRHAPTAASLRRELAEIRRFRKQLTRQIERPTGRLGVASPIARRIRSWRTLARIGDTTRQLQERLDGIEAEERALVDALALDEEAFARSRASLIDDLQIVESGDVHPKSRVQPNWREGLPTLLEFERVFGPALDAMDIDLLHVHDFPLLGIGARAAGRSIRRKKRFQLLYDAHEYVAGLVYATPEVGDAWLDLEDEYIHCADAVVTVSEPIADAIHARYGVARPDVVLNAPVATAADVPAPSIRSLAGFSPDDTVIVYSGGLAAERNVDVVVGGLSLLPDSVKLAIVANNGAAVDRLVEALEPEVAARISAVPFVEPHLLPSYLSEADLAVHPMDPNSENHQLALPNKLFDYLHARLPMVVSDCRTMRAFVESHGLGVGFDGVDSGAFADAVRAILGRFDEYQQRCDGAAGLRRDHTWERQSEVLLGAYGRLLDAEFEPVAALPAPAIEKKLAFYPVNAAAAATRWAERLEHSGRPTEVFERERHKKRPKGGRLFSAAEATSTQFRLSASATLLKCSHVVIESGQSLFGAMPERRSIDDLPFLDAAGLKVALLFHGSDVRLPSRHAKLVESSPFAEKSSTTWALEAIAAKVLSDLETPALERLPKFVSTVDLLDYVPDATWLPVTVDTGRGAAERSERTVPIVVHAPTSPLMKGSDEIDDACTRLDRAGVIRYERVEDLVHDELLEAFAGADIVIDGIVLGAYGTVSVEAMAAGAAVIANLERIDGRMPEQPPIVHADPGSIEEVVTELAADGERRERLGREGRDFAQRWHDGRVAVDVLNRFLAR